MADIFKRKQVNANKPITADMVLIEWEGFLAEAASVSLQYNQPVQRRWTLGSPNSTNCVIYPGRPMGSLQISRLFASGVDNIFDRPGWDPCGDPATIHIQMDGSSMFENCTAQGGIFVCRTCIATGYNFQAEAEGLTIVDNINIEFMQLDYTPGASIA